MATTKKLAYLAANLLTKSEVSKLHHTIALPMNVVQVVEMLWPLWVFLLGLLSLFSFQGRISSSFGLVLLLILMLFLALPFVPSTVENSQSTERQEGPRDSSSVINPPPNPNKETKSSPSTDLSTDRPTTPLPTFHLKGSYPSGFLRETLAKRLNRRHSSRSKLKIRIDSKQGQEALQMTEKGQFYILPQGPLEILVNDKPCCCSEAIQHKSIAVPGYLESQFEKVKIQRIEQAFLEHLEQIIPIIQDCIKNKNKR